MLVIRLQRTGRKGHAQFRVVVQDSRRTPTSGKIVAQLGTYDPHSKAIILDKERTAHYLEHGAQPSDRVVRLLTTEGIKLPNWVTTSDQKAGKLRHPEKLRRNQPKAESVPEPKETPTEPDAESTEPVATEEPTTETAPASKKA